MGFVEKLITGAENRFNREGLPSIDAVGWMFIAILAALTVILIVPVFLLLKTSFWTTGPFDAGGTFTLENYITAYLDPTTYTLYYNTLVIAAGSMLFACFVGIGMAWIVARTNTPFRKFISFSMLLPYPTPAYLIAVSYIFLLGPQVGWLNIAIFSKLGFTLNIFSLWGIILVIGISQSTLPFLITIAAFRNMDPALEDASRMAGAGVFKSLRHITLPLVLPSASAAALLVFTKQLDAFGVPIFLGLEADPAIHVFATKIWSAVSRESPADYALATALSTTLLVLGIIGLYLQRKATGLREKYVTVTGEGYTPKRYDLGRARWVGFFAAVVILTISIILPFIMLFLTSVSKPWIGELWFRNDFVSLTAEHYQTIFQIDAFTRSVTNSLIIGVVGATTGMLFISLASYLVIKVDEDRSALVSRSSPLLDNFLFLPAAIPGVVFALGILWTVLTVPTFGLYGSIWLIMLAYIARELPVGSRTVYGSITQISDELEDQSYVAGATWFQTIRKIVLPLISKGFFAGWILLFIAMIKKFSIPIFLYTEKSIVLPVLIYQLNVQGNIERLAAAGVILMGMVVLTVLLAYLLGFDITD